MTKVTALVFILFSLNVMAVDKTPKFKVTWRMDAVKEDSNDNSVLAGMDKEFKFEIPYIRFAVQGHIDEVMSYRVRFRLNKTLAKNSPDKDGTGEGLDYAYIDRKMGASLKLRLGKQVLYHGGWNGSVSSRDEYSFSSSAGNGFALYAVGVGAFYKIAGQNFIVQALNNRTDTNNQQTPLYGINWTTVLANGIINPIATYHINPFENTATAASAKGEITYLSIGHRLKLANFTFDIDYLSTKTDASTNTGKESENAGIATRLAYQVGNWRPQIRYTKIKEETLNTGVVSGDDIDYHAALEYYPNGYANFRYHLAYIINEDKPISGTNVKKTFIKIGMAGSF